MTGRKPKVPDSLPAGVWRELLPHAFALVEYCPRAQAA